ncbi:MAG TPA: cell division protein FtsZ [Bacteroidales bacterium]|nr:cell division protein FtsZ [Bacteroidales bacterium]
MAEMLKFELPKNQSSIIKVIGVGGGGSNAVNHMFKQGIKGVDFIICNTDAQAMETSPVPTRIQLGANLTGGLGAGAAPSVGRNAALENAEDLRAVLEKETKMLFITAGLGGGTGTGAAPVIAQISRELDILTVGIVTIPFAFEGRKRRQSAEEGIRQLKQHVDALLIISNDKLRLLCGDLPLSEAFTRADNVLTTAAKGIAEIITVAGYINVDFEDVKTVMKNSGVAIMGTGVAGGPNRAQEAVEEALNSPLLDNNDINGAGNLLLYISSGKKEITMDEVSDITDYIQEKTKSTGDIIWGNGYEEALDDKISVTIIATGFDEDHKQKGPAEPETVKVFTLYNPDEPKIEKRMVNAELEKPEPREISFGIPEITAAPEPVSITPEPEVQIPETIRTVEFSFEKPEPDSIPETAESMTEELKPAVTDEISEPQIIFRPQPASPAPEPSEPDANDFQTKKAFERVSKLRQLSEKLKTHQPIEQNLYEIENIPAYKRRNVELTDVVPSSESQVAGYTVTEGSDKSVEIRTENKFLNKKVD